MYIFVEYMYIHILTESEELLLNDLLTLTIIVLFFPQQSENGYFLESQEGNHLVFSNNLKKKTCFDLY